MAGLLGDIGDYIYGDDTTKDAEGRTQYDRRQPYFQGIGAGLGRMGGLLMAAGMPMHNEQRAQLMAQMGGALGGIPGDILAAKEAQAKGILQQQTIATSKNKLENQARIRAYAATPEGQEALAKLQPHERFAAKIAIDGGDIDAFGRIMGGIGKAEHAQRMLDLRTQIFEAKKAAAENAGPMKGTSEPAQLRNWLMTKPPDSQEYAQAYDYFSKDRQITQNGVTTVEPAMDLDARGYAKPTWVGPAGGAGPGALPPNAPPAGQTVPMPDGGTVETSYDGKSVTVTDPGGNQTVHREGQPVKRIPYRVDPAKEKDFEKAEREALPAIIQLEKFRDRMKNAPPEERLKALAGSSILNTDYGLSIMLAKGEVLLNLGVLNGGDMDRIREILADPRTFKGTVADYQAQVQSIVDLMKSKLDIHRRQTYGANQRKAAPPAAGAPAQPPPAPAPGAKPGQVPVGRTPSGQPVYLHSDGKQYLEPEQ